MNYTYTEISKEDKVAVLDSMIVFYLEQKQTLLDNMEEIQSYNKPEKVSMAVEAIDDYTNKIKTLNSILQAL